MAARIIEWDRTTLYEQIQARQEQREVLLKLIEGLQAEDWEQRENEFRFLGRRQIAKFSPTDGRPQVYEYTLVSLDAFAANNGPFTGLFDHYEEVTAREVNAAFRPEARCYDPTGMAKHRLLQGMFWFPLKDWKQCPSIMARNGDVMEWVEETLKSLRRPDGTLPSWLLEGEHDESSPLTTKVLKRYPFSGARESKKRSHHKLPLSLTEGLRRVCFLRGRPLEAEHPYGNSRFFSVLLIRNGGKIEIWKGRSKLGVLRPTQRYVLRHGLQRVRDLHAHLPEIANLRGYLRVKQPGGRVVSILPPVVERFGAREFLVCDGTHRIVELCWNQNLQLRAVMAEEPSAPYYARPFGANEWDVTAGNELIGPPDLHSKYAPRPFPGDHRPDSYRAYFRDFNTGFRDLGGQGGKAV